MPQQGLITKKNLKYPDSTATIPKGEVNLVNLPDLIFAEVTLEPGWQWSKDIKPTAGTQFCETQHSGLCVTGHMQVEMQNGEMTEIEPGDVFNIPTDHDAWVLGNEQFRYYDFGGEMGEYVERLQQ